MMSRITATPTAIHDSGSWIECEITDGWHTYRITVKLGEDSSRDRAIRKFHELTGNAEKAAQYQPGCASGAKRKYKRIGKAASAQGAGP